MNAKGRKEVEALIGRIAQIREELELIRESEQEKFDNLTEGLQVSALGEKLESVIDSLDNAISSIEDTESSLLEITDN